MEEQQLPVNQETSESHLNGLGMRPGEAAREQLDDLVLLVELCQGGLAGFVVGRKALVAIAPSANNITL